MRRREDTKNQHPKSVSRKSELRVARRAESATARPVSGRVVASDAAKLT